MEESQKNSVLAPGYNYQSATDKISSVVLTPKTPRFWWVGFLISFVFMMVFFASVTYLFYKGIGIWGVNIPVAWGFALSNFVWWIGIGHAGTFISAFLLLLRQNWRTSINRFAEAMTLFAVANAGMYPILHLGRPQFLYYLFPYPNVMHLYPQWRSPLVWDFFAIATYASVSIMFWYMGLIPDLATFRDRAHSRFGQIFYGLLSLGWRNSARHWQRFHRAYFLMAALATPLVISVHSIVSLDFSAGIVPGWHSTIFPPYFVAGAIFSGFAMVLTLAIPLRSFYHFEDFITMYHIDIMARIMLAMGLVVAYGYLMEFFMAWYSGNPYDVGQTVYRFTGPYAPFFYAMLVCNVLVPQLLWIKRVRFNLPLLFVISLLINLGMWFERLIIVIASTANDFMPSSWGIFIPTFWDWSTFLGTLGLFISLLFIFVRLLPAISMFELRDLVRKQQEGEVD
jgi:molybdopterin-containing oxidoreductase family membrane subunit